MGCSHMSGVPRYRTFNDTIQVTGSCYYITWRYNTMSYGEYGSCDDIVGNPEGANPLVIRKIIKKTPVLNGEYCYKPPKVTRGFYGYPIGYSINSPPDPNTVYASPNSAELEGYAWEIQAKTNVSSPHVNIPQQIGELKDIPDLIRGWGRGLIRNIAKGHLSWRWGLKPMIGDVRKMLQFVEVANKRFKELRSLRDGKAIRKRCSLGSSQYKKAPVRVLINSVGATVYATRTDVYTRKRWGSIEWKLKPDSVIHDMEDRKLHQFTRRLMLGITAASELEAAWELVPWSWFIDWFTNVGTLMAATNNSVQCTHGRCCVMQTSTAEARFSQAPGDMSSYYSLDGEWDWRYVRKVRQLAIPIIPFPSPHLPVLDGRKLSILASLAALRR